MAQVQVMVSSPTKEGLVKALNMHFYSSTYDINEEGKVT